MKKLVSMMVVFAAVVLMGMGIGFAGKGKGPGDGTGPIHDILGGVPFDVTGTVVTVAMGDGLQIAVDGKNLTIYGIGPSWYWKKLDVDRPVVGDTVAVSGFIVDFNGVERYIAMSITVDGETIQLRDPKTGAPLWKGGQGKGKDNGKNKGNGQGRK
jgi:hypothetical protein